MESFTNLVNYAALAMSVWLGLYLVTRSSHSHIAWLSALTLWSMAGMFLNSLLALNPPPSDLSWPAWTHFFLPFWSSTALLSGWTKWLQGWLVIPAVAFWHHATLLMLPGKMTAWHWTRLAVVYGSALFAIFSLLYTPWLVEQVSGDPLSLDAFVPGPLFLIFLGMLFFYTLLCIYNLLHAARGANSSAARKQVLILAGATALAGLTSLVAFLHFTYTLHLPTVTLSILLACAVFLTGFGVARYSALIQGRTSMRDFQYNATAMAVVVLVYMTVTWFSVSLYMVPPMAFIFVLILAIVSHSLIDFARRSLDLLFFRKNARDMRANLREMSRLVGENNNQAGNYTQLLGSICDSIQASCGLLVLFKNGQARLEATSGWKGTEFQIDPASLCSEDIKLLEPTRLPEPLAGIAVLVPLFSDGIQVGAVLIGSPQDGTQFSEADIDLLYYSCDQLANFVSDNLRKESYLKEVEKLAFNSQAVLKTSRDYVSSGDVEDSLRNLYDYAYLGDTTLTRMKSIQSFMAPGNITHLDRGRAVNSLLVQGIEKLRPEAKDYCGQPPREWYPYLILRSAYIEDQSNREIMSQLYISEGTFNRTRRSAIRAVTRALNEIEATTA